MDMSSRKKSFFSPVFFEKNFEDPEVLSRLEAILKKKRGYNFKMPTKNSPVILIVSGGLDSTMLWYNLLSKYQLQVYPIHFVGPHSILGERLSVNFFYSYFKKRFPELVKPVKFIPAYFNFSLKDDANKKILNNNFILMTRNLFVNKKTRDKKVFFVNYPVRWAYYSLAAYEYGLELQAKNVPVHTIFTGTVPDDSLVSRESTLTTLRAVNAYFCSLFGDWEWQITGPVEKRRGFFYPKKDSIKIGYKNGVPLEKTWSCGNNFIKQCGLCPTCKLRQWTFKEAGIKDKTFYFVSDKTRDFLKKIYLKLSTIFNQKASPRPKRLTNITVSTNVVEYQDKESSYVFNKKTGEIIQINPTGKYILRLLKQNPEITFIKLIKKFQAHYPELNKNQLKKEVAGFLKELLKKEFIFGK